MVELRWLRKSIAEQWKIHSMAGSDHFYGRKNPGIIVKFCGCLLLQEIFRKKEREDENMSETSVNQRKVAMIGCGFVGSATALH